jgi:hypothetical protein
MRGAIVVVGSHCVGKSRTLNNHLKPLLGMNPSDNGFCVNNVYGFLWSQTIEECEADPCIRIGDRRTYDLLVVPARPRWEDVTQLDNVIRVLNIYGYTWQEIYIRGGMVDGYYELQANAMHSLLQEFTQAS